MTLSTLGEPMSDTEKLPSIAIRSFQAPFDPEAIVRLGSVLPAHVATRRWYRAKARTVRELAIEDVVQLGPQQDYLLVLKIGYEEGEPDLYILPVSATPGGEPAREEAVVNLVAANGEEGVLSSALSDAGFRDRLIHAIACEESYEGQNGVLHAHRTRAFSEECAPDPPHFDSFVSRAEQSNTSVIYRGKYILKIFRKLEPGINPDLEIGEFLTARGFGNTPPALGSLTYELNSNREIYGAGILQQFVANRGDAWAYTLESLQDFFERALANNNAPEVGPYLASAALLGKRTAEMHAALADPNGGPDFAPEDFAAGDGNRLHAELVRQAETTFELLRRKSSGLHGPLADRVRELIALEPAVAERLQAVNHQASSAKRIRHHGDYHLGQVLFTGDDFMIIDFEGEPARPLSERRAKALGLRDVAGMLRSFEYAAFAVLFGQVPGVAVNSQNKASIEKWAAGWNQAVSAAYLRGYFEQAGSANFVPHSDEEQRLFLDAFLLQKALYEVAYELNNRPDWLQIPVGGILRLLGGATSNHG